MGYGRGTVPSTVICTVVGAIFIVMSKQTDMYDGGWKLTQNVKCWNLGYNKRINFSID